MHRSRLLYTLALCWSFAVASCGGTASGGGGVAPPDVATGAGPDGGGGQPEIPDMPPSFYSQVTVSLTFDDGLASQWATLDILDAHQQKATYFIISTKLGGKGYLTQEQITTLEQDGHEIGGHTRTHPDLTTLPPDQATAEICGGKSDLEGMGFNIRSFAYPFNSWNPTLQSIISGCGMNSARRASGISDHVCDKCVRSETIPPLAPLALRAVDSVSADDSLPTLQQFVYDAASGGGGWVIFVFHFVCDPPCGVHSIAPNLFQDFTNWLDAKEIEVQRVRDVLDR